MAKMRITLEAEGPGFQCLTERFGRNQWAVTLLHMFMAQEPDDFADNDLPSWDDLDLRNFSVTVADDEGYVDSHEPQQAASSLLHESEIP